MSEIFSRISQNIAGFNTGSGSEVHSNGSSNRFDTENNSLNESFTGIVTSFTVYKLLNELVKPFMQLEAFRAGLIDSNGNFIKPESAYTRRDHQILSPFNRLVIGIKRLIQASGSARLKADFGFVQTAARAMAFECKQLGGDQDLFLEELQKAVSVLCEEGEGGVSMGNMVGGQQSTEPAPAGNYIGGGFLNPQVGDKVNPAIAGYSKPMNLLRRKRRTGNGVVES